MNRGHAPLCDWVLNTVSWTDGAKVLDVGCGGGANIDRMFQKISQLSHRRYRLFC